MSFAEIAKQLGVTQYTAMRILERALEKIQRRLSAHGYDERTFNRDAFFDALEKLEGK
jgi:DNA-directed RNA polymerase specialized sigma24 family protein